MSAVGDARKRHVEQHHTHPDPAVRELIAAAEARGAERVAQAVERALEGKFRAFIGTAPSVHFEAVHAHDIRAALNEATR